MKFLLAAVAATLLFAVTSCATGNNKSNTENFENSVSKTCNETKVLAKKSYSKVKDIAAEYCTALLDTAKSFNTKAPKDLDPHFIVGEDALKPGYLYASKDVTSVFTLIDYSSVLDEKGFMKASVSGKSVMIDPITWAFSGDKTYLFEYRFVWFNANGEIVENNVPARIRETIPGDRVNFVGHAPSEDCTQFSMVLALIQPDLELEKENAEKDSGSATVLADDGDASAEAGKE